MITRYKATQMAVLIDFQWQKDSAGYRLVDAEPRRTSEPRVHPIFGKVFPSLLELAGKPQRVVRNGGKLVTYEPFKRFDRLFRSFASLQTPEDVLHFIENFGPLTDWGLDIDRGEDVPHVLEHATAFREWLSLSPRRLTQKQLANWIGNEEMVFAKLQASLYLDDSGALRFRISPRSLVAGLWFQLAQTLTGETTIRACLHCGQLFEAGRGTDRRLDAKFCSDEHRIAFNSLRRSRE
jgi:hypothetical protein